jgi:lipid II:glycine glycyltransferase (peptidoglycan interpeptide bridge formation enzyme)
MTEQQAEMATISLRVSNIEQDVKRVQDKFVSQQVIDLQLQNYKLQLDNMDQSLKRMERDQQASKEDQVQQLKTLNDKIDTQGAKIDKLQIKGLTWVVVTIVSMVIGILIAVVSGLIIYYLTRPGG